MSKNAKSIRYRVFITPLATSNDYGDQIEISDLVSVDGIQKIRRSIDSGDYQIGVYTYGDINLKAFNINGYFNTSDDHRSIFEATRDRAKIEIQFIEIDSLGEETAKITFRGLVNEEATRVDARNDIINFRILSEDSVIRNDKVAAGAIAAGNTVKTAILSILDVPRITKILTIDGANINPNLNTILDVGSVYDNEPKKRVLDELLLISNSAMLIRDSTVYIQSREESTDIDPLNLYGPHDEHKRENILDLTKYNTGFHRVFSSVKVNTQEKNSAGIVEDLGTRQKEIEIESITDASKSATIAQRLLDEFKAPKIEINVKVATRLVKDYDLLDRVSINWPLRAKPRPGNFLPVIGVTKIGDATDPLPDTFGSLEISPNIAFKIIEIDENPKTFESILKLRQVGTELFDGMFNAPGNSIIGFAVIGEAVIGIGDTDPWNPSVLGAAKIGETEVA